MYCLSDKQIEYILNDIRRNGVEMEDLQLNLLDHICCIIEQNLEENGDFENFYSATLKTFYKKELREIEEETKTLLTFKNYYSCLTYSHQLIKQNVQQELHLIAHLFLTDCI